eukprot:scaffold106306_cov31-Prasinocladus_malaysianus.AAC.1
MTVCFHAHRTHCGKQLCIGIIRRLTGLSLKTFKHCHLSHCAMTTPAIALPVLAAAKGATTRKRNYSSLPSLPNTRYLKVKHQTEIAKHTGAMKSKVSPKQAAHDVKVSAKAPYAERHASKVSQPPNLMTSNAKTTNKKPASKKDRMTPEAAAALDKHGGHVPKAVFLERSLLVEAVQEAEEDDALDEGVAIHISPNDIHHHPGHGH